MQSPPCCLQRLCSLSAEGMECAFKQGARGQKRKSMRAKVQLCFAPGLCLCVLRDACHACRTCAFNSPVPSDAHHP
eukprot:1161902-Pelagomonas_calceolata.AAC.18